MDKKLALALGVCLLILIGWPLLFPPPRHASTSPASTSPGAPVSGTGAPASVPGTAGTPASSAAASDDLRPNAGTGPENSAPAASNRGPVTEGVDEPDLVLTVGEAGLPGHFRAVFANRGGALSELRTGEYFDRAGLTDEEKADPEHWTKLLVPVDATGPGQAAVPGQGGGRTASMLLRAAPSSERIVKAPLETALWARRVLGTIEAPQGVEFTLAQGTGVTFTKRYLFAAGEDVVRFELEVENDDLDDAVARAASEFVLTPAASMPPESGDRWYSEPQAISCVQHDGAAKATAQVIDEKGGEVQGSFPKGSSISFCGVFNKYFAVLLHGADAESRATLIDASWRRLRDEDYARTHPEHADRAWKQIVADLQLRIALPPRGESRTFRYDVYAGPKTRDRLELAWPDYEKVVEHDLGMFSGIASVLLAVLNFYEAITKNWGVAIILLTITVRALLFPVNRRSQTAMSRYQAKMKRLQPRIDEIKKRYAKDAAAQRSEQTKLMQEEGAFPPLGGCLPMFLQIPVFIGLFAALRASFDLRQADFGLWIHDLSVPDQFMRLGWKLPLVGPLEYLNLLPLLMVVLWIWQQKGMPVPTDEQQARMQKMMMWMPVMMGFFLYNYAAGLSLYMITQSGLGIVEQKVIKKVWPLDETEKPKKSGGFMKKLMEAQQKQMKQHEGKRKKPRY